MSLETVMGREVYCTLGRAWSRGGPLALVTYDIGVLLLIKRLKAAYLDVTQTWYADDVGALGTYENIMSYFN